MNFDLIIEMIIDLQNFYYYNDRLPIQLELKLNGCYSHETYRNYFGGLKKSFIASSLPVNELTREEYLKKYKEEHKKEEKEYSKKYYKLNKKKCLQNSLQWNKSNKDKVSKSICRWKKNNPDKIRERRAIRKGWGFNPINKYFKGSHGHHLHINNHYEILYIPEEIHRSVCHRYYDQESMQKINDIAFEWYFTQNLQLEEY